MKVVLRDDVGSLGQKGDLVEVKPGYARNYLVPRGLAIVANRGVVAQSEAMKRNRSARDRREREAAQALASSLSGRALTIVARAGEGGKLFGSVGAADVASAVHEQLGVEIDRRTVGGVDEPWKELGTFEVTIRLHADVVPTVTVNVVGG
ncbi:MAG TPA: 50S ribosomal protein L9 [Acidimicrobiia bacterium]|jgi:large subunit ribosomal protein L9